MKNVLTFLAICIAISVQAQDQIILKSGETIQAQVLELAPDQIKYKRFDHLTGPTIVIKRNEVFLINYENGKSEVISVLDAAPTPATPSNVAPATPVTSVPQTTTSRTYQYSSLRPSLSYDSYEEEQLLIAGGAALPFNDAYSTGFYLGLEGDWFSSRNFGWTSNVYLVYNDTSGEYYYDSGAAMDALLQSGFIVRTDPSFLSFYFKGLIGTAYTSYSGEGDDTFSFTAGGGLGLVFDDTVDIGLRYYNFVGGNFSQLQVGIGYRFN